MPEVTVEKSRNNDKSGSPSFRGNEVFNNNLLNTGKSTKASDSGAHFESQYSSLFKSSFVSLIIKLIKLEHN